MTSSNQQLEVRAPFDDSVIAVLKKTPAAAVEQALSEAQALYRSRKGWLEASDRAEILHRASHVMGDRREELALQAAREGGKPLVDSRIEVDRAIDGVKLCVEILRTESGTQVPMNNPASKNRLAFTYFEPIGPVVAVSAFNHPLNLIVHQVGPAVAAGCPVIIKPAADTPLSCLSFVEILRECGLPDEWCRVVITDENDVAEKLVTDARVAFFSFIGSAKVGWMLRSRLSPGTRCALEHGGAAPVVVAADADLDDIIPLLTRGGFYHAGQVCVSVQRVFVERKIAREVAERLAEGAGALSTGDPTKEETEVGPLIRKAEVARVHKWILAAQESGAELLAGGEPIGESGFAPTVLFEPSDEALVSSQEIFGPVICVYAYDDVDDAIQRANALPFAFQAAVCTKSIDTAMHVSTRLDASAVMVNDHTAFRVDWMPFAGLRQSGLGVGGIEHTMADMQIEKMVVMRSREI